MKIPESRLKAGILFLFLAVIGLSMMAGPCYDPTTPTPLGGGDPYRPPTPEPTWPVTPPTVTPSAAKNAPRESQPALARAVAVEPTKSTDAPPPEDTVAASRPKSAAETPFTEAVAVDTGPRDVSKTLLFTPQPGGVGFDIGYEPETVEELLEKGMFAAEASPTHIALRGIPEAGSVRCEWQGIARTLHQREEAIRFWLALGDDAALPSPSELEATFTAHVDRMGPGIREAMRATFIALARGGQTNEYFNLYCYVDYAVSEYLLGTGPAEVTLAYDTTEKAYSYDLYQRAHESGAFEFEPLMSREEHQESSIDQPIKDAERELSSAVSGRGSVVFLVPVGVHNNIAVEAWQIIALWDLQENDDGVLQAVRYNLRRDHPEAAQTLANLTSRITTAVAGDDFADTRIESIGDLAGSYRTMGAYSDIRPADGDPSAYTPSQPLPVQVCAGSASIGAGAGLQLLRDCSILLDLKDALAGTATLNWSKNTAIASWTDVTVSGNPQRVTALALASSSLDGAIPAALGRLHGLLSLDLSSNSLTGSIPAALGNIPELTTLRLSGNSFSGCIPPTLRDVATNDLASIGLSYCDMPPPSPSE